MATAVDAYLYFDEDEASLPNPLALLAEDPAADKPVGADSVVNALCGKTHGDLHTENILLRLEPSPAPDGYWLVDLAKYSARAPLARDATHLMLYVIARTLTGLSPSSAPPSFASWSMGTADAVRASCPDGSGSS